MRNVRRVFRISLFLILGLFLHYVLPQHDVVRVVKTEDFRTDFSVWNRIFYAQADAGATELKTRQVRLINTVRKRTFLLGLIRGGDQTMVYRNEDTGWIWPPYFKFDSSNLDTEAQDLVSTPEDPKWAVITHYGWRIKLLTVFPNAVAIREVDGPDVRIIPWFNIFFFIFLAVAYFFLRAMWRQFRERSIEPVLADAGEAWDTVDDHADAAREHARGIWGRFMAWLGTWQGRPRK